MQLDRAIFAIEPRTVGGCIDLAVAFLREHFLGILRLTVCFAVPFCAVSWWLIAERNWFLTHCLLLFALVSPFLGAALVGAAGQRVFGEQFSVRSGFKAILQRLFALASLLLIARSLSILGGLLVLPGYLIATRYAFLSEILILEQSPFRRYELRLNHLLRYTFANPLGRLVMIASFYTLTVISLFVLVDATSGLLFGFPILAGRISEAAYAVDELMVLLTVDPAIATLLFALMWIVYPVARLAWFFCYLDVRIRKEGWDVELDFRIEAARLTGAV